MSVVMKIFHTSAHCYLTVGSGLDVYTTDLMDMQDTASTKLHLIMQRWFDADRNVNWDTLVNLCDDFNFLFIIFYHQNQYYITNNNNNILIIIIIILIIIIIMD